MSFRRRRRNSRNSTDDSVISILEQCKCKGIGMLAFDFDKTLISIHTGGCWREGPKELVTYFRPCFKQLMSAALMETDLHVCIVTYSRQPYLIREVLHRVLPKCDTSKVIVKGNTRDFMEKMKFPARGKESHIDFVLNELYLRKGAVVQPREVLLLDDDPDNVALARKFGHKAFLVQDDVSLETLGAFLKTLDDK